MRFATLPSLCLEFLPSLRYRCCARLCCCSCRHHSLHVQSRLSRCPRKVFCRIHQRRRQFIFGDVMLSPLSFSIFVMSTFFFADCLFILFFSDAFFLSICSDLSGLNESQDFSIFVREVFTHFCCCRCRHVCFFVVVLELARVAAGM